MNYYSTNMQLIDNMDGHSFEYFCADILIKLGYTFVNVTKASGDNGVDITAFLNGQSYAIQCKRFSKKVGNRAIQEVFSGKSYYNCSKAVVITNNYFTDQAIDTANKLGVILWDRDFLSRMINGAYSNSEKVKKSITKSNYKAKQQKSNSSTGCGSFIFFVILVILVIIFFSENP